MRRYKISNLRSVIKVGGVSSSLTDSGPCDPSFLVTLRRVSNGLRNRFLKYIYEGKSVIDLYSSSNDVICVIGIKIVIEMYLLIITTKKSFYSLLDSQIHWEVTSVSNMHCPCFELY